VTDLVLLDDETARGFQPFALTRPVGELRAGIELIRRRWESAFGSAARGRISAPQLDDFEETGCPAPATPLLAAGTVVASSRFVASLGQQLPDAERWCSGGRVSAVRLSRDTPAEALIADGALERLAATRTAEVRGRWLDGVWQLVTDLVPQLSEDLGTLIDRYRQPVPQGSIVIGTHPVLLEEGASIEPMVCFDVTAGPVLVRRGAHIRAFTRLAGPCAVLSGAAVLGDRVSASVIGEGCIVRGEMSETVVLGLSNKAHDGFVGHSYIGRWVNIGAGTITSDLKNTYDTVSIWTPGGMRDTGSAKVGSLIGDHVKLGIGTRLTTGSVVGAGSNVFGSVMSPKLIPPFSWGDGHDGAVYRLDKFLDTTERAMARRDQSLGATGRRLFARLHEMARGPSAERG